MKHPMRVAMVCLSVVSLLAGFREVYAQTSPEPMNRGKLIMAENPDGGGRTCGIPFPDSGYLMVNLIKNSYGCSDDDYSYFMLEGAPSVAKVGFYSDKDCPGFPTSGNDWNFVVGTYKQPTQTIWISLRTLNTHQPNDIIKAGVKLKSKRYRTGDIEAEVECVTLETSPLP